MRKLDDRLVGVSLSPEILDKINNHLHTAAFKTIHVNLNITDSFIFLLNSCASSLTCLKFSYVTIKQDKRVSCQLSNLQILEIINCEGGNLFFSSLVNQSSRTLKKMIVQDHSDREALTFLDEVDKEMKSLIKVDIYQRKNEFIGLDNILSRSPQLQTLELTSPYIDMSDQSVPGINLSRCEFRCMMRLVLSNVILEANTSKNLLSNVPHLQYLELSNCYLEGHEMITCQAPELVWLDVFSIKSCSPAIIVSPNLQVK